MLENEIMKKIQIQMSTLSNRVWRNNSGLFYTKMGTPVRCGLCVGSSDLIGYAPVKITADMIGKTVAVFLAIECKSRRGREEQDQIAFALAVQKAGGCAFFARSVEEAVEKIQNFIDRTKIAV
jgi:hypothetical protein